MTHQAAKIRHMEIACSLPSSAVAPWHRYSSTSGSAWLLSDYYAQQPRMLIFQHFNLHNDRIRKLQTLSADQHRRYADFWGYQYLSSSDQYVSEDDTTVRQRQMNKVYALLKVVIGELGKGNNGAEWIQ